MYDSLLPGKLSKPRSVRDLGSSRQNLGCPERGSQAPKLAVSGRLGPRDDFFDAADSWRHPEPKDLAKLGEDAELLGT